MTAGHPIFYPEAETFEEAIQFAIQRHGNNPIQEQLRNEIFAMISNKSAKFIAKHLNNDEVISDFEEFLRDIGVMKRQ